jgi:hypothetical protein
MDIDNDTTSAAASEPAEPVTSAPDVTQESEPVQAQSADVPDDFVPETELDGEGHISIDNGKDE